MPVIFYDSQKGPEIRRLLNEMVLLFEDAISNAKGPQGWSPALSLAIDGDRIVLRVVDWVGGEGDKPVERGYIGETGFVANIADALSIRGLRGLQGENVTLRVTATHIQWRIGEGEWEDLIALSELTGAQGDAAWTQVTAVVTDGERRVLRVVDWFGGQGDKPLFGQYIGPDGYVTDISQATDMRGPAGSGSVSTVCDVDPDSSGNVALTASDVDADPAGSAAAVALNLANLDASLKPVAKSGSFNDLTDQPVIPAEQQQTDWNAASGITAIANKPAVIAAGANQAAARSAIGAGTSNLTLGSTASTAKPGNYQPTAEDISNSTATGRSVLKATDAAAARAAIGAGVGDVTLNGAEVLGNKTLNNAAESIVTGTNSVDISAISFAEISPTGTITLTALTGATQNGRSCLLLVNVASGTRAFAANSNVVWNGASPSLAAGTHPVSFVYSSTKSKWLATTGSLWSV